MCNCECHRPELLKGNKPEECTPEQIRECHGDVQNHPCVSETKSIETKEAE
jgi:hypothetical protein